MSGGVRHDVRGAVSALLATASADEAGALVAGLAVRDAEALDVHDVEAVVAALGTDGVRCHPRVLLVLAWACEPGAHVRRRARALEQLEELIAGDTSAALRREVLAELARDRIRDGDVDAARALASSALGELDAHGAGDAAADVVRGRLLTTIGMCEAWARDGDALARAATLLGEAIACCRRAGARRWAVQASIALAVTVNFAAGEWERAAAVLSDALEDTPPGSHYRAVVLSYRGDVLAYGGRLDEATRDLDEARAVARSLGDTRATAYALWSLATLASCGGDAARTRTLLAEAESHRGDWLEHPSGAQFLADAADALSRAGDVEGALEYLARAQRRVAEAEGAVLLAEGAVLARAGDPVRADEALRAAAHHPTAEPRDRWRTNLLRAYAALRRGDEVASTLAADAFERAAALGTPTLPLVREHTVARRLLPLAVEAGSSAAAALCRDDGTLEVSVLGTFAVSRGGAPLSIPAGRPATLLALVAVSGGECHVEEAIEALWPDVDPHDGRRRLSHVLNRLRSSAGDVVVRRGDVLALPPGAEIDARAFEVAARRALVAHRADDAGAEARAWSALARYGGQLLPTEPFATWAAAPRTRLRRLHVDLLTIVAHAAAARGAVDEPVRLLQRASDDDPYDEDRHLAVARLLADAGRKAAAMAALAGARRRLAELGVAPSPAFEDLEAGLRR